MSWQKRYLPPDPHHWLGRNDIPADSCFFQVMQTINLVQDHCDHLALPGFAFLGFRCDEGIRRNFGRTGAADGPTSLRHALGKMPVHHPFYCYDVGAIVCRDNDLEDAQKSLAEVLALLLDHGLIPCVIGGGHELAWGHYQGINKIYPQQRLGIVNFDAHFDMRQLLPNRMGSSGTPFLQIAFDQQKTQRHFDYNVIGVQPAANIHQLFETAQAHKVNYLLANDLHSHYIEKSTDFIDRIIDENEIIYVTICLDVFSAAFAPGVSASQPVGISPWHIIPLLRQLAASGKVISYDVVELSPRYDVDQRTAKLAAALICEVMQNTLVRG